MNADRMRVEAGDEVPPAPEPRPIPRHEPEPEEAPRELPPPQRIWDEGSRARRNPSAFWRCLIGIGALALLLAVCTACCTAVKKTKPNDLAGLEKMKEKRLLIAETQVSNLESQVTSLTVMVSNLTQRLAAETAAKTAGTAQATCPRQPVAPAPRMDIQVPTQGAKLPRVQAGNMAIQSGNGIAIQNNYFGGMPSAGESRSAITADDRTAARIRDLLESRANLVYTQTIDENEFTRNARTAHIKQIDVEIARLQRR